MLRKAATTLQLEEHDVTELIAELEEEKLQVQLQSQRKNLLRTSTENNYNGLADSSINSINQEVQTSQLRNGEMSNQTASLFQTSPIDNTKHYPSIPERSVDTKNSNNNQNHNNEYNPFYNQRNE
ncbi:hypothetical protein TPHA_0C01410 [Tetrapisispora phaffii CBS 4417]|uniref:Uncharacterized protein n=1 Tax=Tetrapisispora phaffii (strain ATCC 24235 / CBS 4417 / NBRC 1672 / NRRL Y-8282 / UCD 70-5) TaxID=1071381 RepID=G8BRC1_TETPH|nr:hypothetical protein TPHA_0C01410 [Tetrapisispora phaffii CBS 4417]CCE62297.1 hypothetical protein TPHA_0C01410 [Tetrapisispora phaffii CBS 4417]